MLNGEASSNLKPPEMMKRYKSVKRTIRGYFTVVCILFVVVLLLCASNFIAYSSYRNIQEQFDTAFLKAETVISDKRNLEGSNEFLKKENESLKVNNKEILAQNQEILRQIEEIKKQNSELIRKNNELIGDNIALQNTLKQAASVGIKPQNFTNFRGITSRGELNRGSYVGAFLGTAYTPSKEECGNNKGITNSGKPIIPGISIAVDNKYWPFGTVFYIKGLGYAVAMDTGSAIKGKYRFDFAVLDKKFAQMLGQKSWEVYLIKVGNGKVGDIKF